MQPKKTQLIAILGIALSATGMALAQSAPSPDNQALINALVKKGILTNDEATQISAEVAKSQSAEDVETSGDPFIQKLTIGGRWQVQYVGLGASISGNPVNPVSTEHFLLRRIYVNFGAQFADGFSGVVS